MGLSAAGAKRLNDLRENLWSLPVLLGLLGVGLGLGLPAAERRFLQLPPSFAPPASSAEALFSTAAGALATILGVAFSLTIVTLQLAAVQYTSRLMRRFMADSLTRIVLGSYLGSISFLALALRSIDAGDSVERGFVPPISTWLGLALFVCCVMLLAIFIHHLARSIQSGPMVAAIGKDTLATLFEREWVRKAPATSVVAVPEEAPAYVSSTTPGYLQLVNWEELLEHAPRGCTCMRVEAIHGQFLLPGRPMLAVWPAHALDDQARRSLQDAFALGSERTLHQDVLYGIRQLVDIALKALSPAVNDVTTALTVINELGAILHKIATGESAGDERAFRVMRGSGITLLVPRLTLETVLHHVFDELPRAALPHPLVLARLIDLLTEVLEATSHPSAKRQLLNTGDRLKQYSDRADLTAWEADVLSRRFAGLASGRVLPGEDPVNPI